MEFTWSRGLYKGLSDIYLVSSTEQIGFPGGSVVKNLPANVGDTGDAASIPWSARSPEQELANHASTTPVFLPGKFHGQQSLAGYSPWVHKESESDTTEWLSTHMDEKTAQGYSPQAQYFRLL